MGLKTILSTTALGLAFAERRRRRRARRLLYARPTRRAGSVGGVRNIKNARSVAKRLSNHTGHVMLVGEGAERFCRGYGFPAREPAHRALAENLAVVEGISLERRLVGAWTGLAAVEAPETSRTRALGRTHPAHEERAASLGIEPEFRMAAIHRVLFPPRHDPLLSVE